MQAAAAMKSMGSTLAGIDASGVEVDDDQEMPPIEVGTAEEAAALAQMDALLPDELKQNAGRIMCLRARKYDAARAAELLPKFVAVQRELGFGEGEPAGPRSARLEADIACGKFVVTGFKDHKGRAICTLRLRFHNPKESKAEDMARLIGSSLLYALRDPEVQRRGVVLHNDVSELGLKNVDPMVPKLLFTKVFPSMPMRLGRIVAYNPPWFVLKVMLPVMRKVLPKKLVQRLFVLDGRDNAELLKHFPPASLADEYGGTAGVIDVGAFAANMAKSQ